jgi:hypothetical protein
MERQQTIGEGPYPRAARAAALLVLFVGALAVWVNLFHTSSTDFISYWAAAVLALGGDPAAAYDVDLHRSVQERVMAREGLMPFGYPPPFLLLVLPFGLLPYSIAAASWVLATFAAYFAVSARAWPGSRWLLLAFPAVLVNAIVGQNGFLTAALFIGGLALLGKRPFLAGLVLGCLVIKPQLGLLLPFAFIAARQWRAFAGAALSSAGLLLLALLLFGSGPYLAMAELAPLLSTIVTDGRAGWHKMASVYASLRLAGLPSGPAWIVHGAVAAAAALATWRVWRSKAGLPAKSAALAAATLLISPYLFLYDTLILLIPFLWLAGAGADRRLLALLWCVPFVSLAQSWGFNDTVNLLPLVPVALLVLIRRQLADPDPRQRLAAALAPAP